MDTQTNITKKETQPEQESQRQDNASSSVEIQSAVFPVEKKKEKNSSGNMGNKRDALGKLEGTLLGKNPFGLSAKQQHIKQPLPQKTPLDNSPSTVQEFMQGKFASSPIKPIRTYRSDVEEAIQNKKESVTTIALAEKKRREKSGEKKKYAKENTAQNSLIIFLTLMLIVTGIGSLFIFLYAKSQEQKAITTFYRQTIVPAEKEEKISIQEDNLSSSIKKKLSTLDLDEGDVAFLEIRSSKTELSAEAAVLEISPSAPAYLLRSLGDYMFGILKQDTNELFILMKTDSFETVFSGMLEWEKTIAQEIGQLFFNAASSTPTQFEDIVIKNKDTRAIRNTQREMLFVYAFLDKEIILIAGNEKVFNNILNRYFNSKLVQ